jgi:tRNA-2-methylthio-N6-dimethylallyladenosine synthase
MCVTRRELIILKFLVLLPSNSTFLPLPPSAYGRDMIPKRRFSDLIRTAGSVPGLKRLRFVTSHPRYMSMGVIDAVAETPTACQAFHVPFQSGSNTILAAMGRGHTNEKYMTIVNRIRSVRILSNHY